MPRDYKLVLEATKAAKRAEGEKAAEEEKLKKSDAFAELQRLAMEAAASGQPPAVEVRGMGGEMWDDFFYQELVPTGFLGVKVESLGGG